MKRGIGWFVVLCVFVLLARGVDAATIVGISGDVRVRAAATDPWQVAAKGQVVVEDTEIQCGSASRCTVALDEMLRNTVTVKENTTVTVEELEPGLVFLKEGRVFSIIRAVAAERPFQVRTPTSISGARGTAWLTDFRTGRTEVSVFEDNVFVSGLDAAGKVTDEIDVATGQGVSIAADGLLGEIFVVPVEQINEWREEKQELEVLHKELGVAPPPAPGTKKGAEPVSAAPGEPKPPEPKKEDAAGVPVAGDAALEPPPMTEEEKLLYEIQKARMETEKLLGTEPPPGPEPGISYDPAMPPPIFMGTGMEAEDEAQEAFMAEPLPEEKLPAGEGPMMDEPMWDEPMSDEPMMDEPMMDEPMMDESMMDEPMMDEPMFDDPMFDDPMMDPELQEEIIDSMHEEELLESSTSCGT